MPPILRFEMLQPPPLLAPMGPDAVEEPDSPPPPPPLGPAHARAAAAAAAKALMYLCLAILWVATTSLGAAAVIEAFPGCEEVCALADALLSGSIAASLFNVLFAIAARLLVWRAGFRVEFTKDTAPFAALLSLLLPQLAGCWLLVVLSFTQEPLIGRMMVEAGAVGYVAITCFGFLAFPALNVWKMKLVSNTAVGSI